jgi:hypothetical protein
MIFYSELHPLCLFFLLFCLPVSVPLYPFRAKHFSVLLLLSLLKLTVVPLKIQVLWDGCPMSTGKYFLMFRRILVLPSSGQAISYKNLQNIKDKQVDQADGKKCNTPTHPP